MLNLLSTAPATLLDFVQLIAYLLVMLVLTIFDIFLSPTLMNMLHLVLAGCTMKDVIRALLWMLYEFLLSAWHSPWPIALLHGVLVMQLLHLLLHFWRVCSGMLGDLLVSFVRGSSSGAGIFAVSHSTVQPGAPLTASTLIGSWAVLISSAYAWHTYSIPLQTFRPFLPLPPTQVHRDQRRYENPGTAG